MNPPNPTKCAKCGAVHDASVSCAAAWGRKPAARLEPSEITAWNGLSIGKRLHVPFRVVDNCPKCGAEHVVDLGSDRYQLSYAKQGLPTGVYFTCAQCDDHEWTVSVIVRLTLEIHDPATITSQLGLRAEETE